MIETFQLKTVEVFKCLKLTICIFITQHFGKVEESLNKLQMLCFLADIVCKLRVIFVIKDKQMEDDSVSPLPAGEESKGNCISLFREPTESEVNSRFSEAVECNPV